MTKTRSGREVDLLQINHPAEGLAPMLLTARNHACETMASYVLEGFVQEALSDSWAGSEFRKRYVLYCVPLIDKDGVEAGDQGKGRRPHDHNRDDATPISTLRSPPSSNSPPRRASSMPWTCTARPCAAIFTRPFTSMAW